MSNVNILSSRGFVNDSCGGSRSFGLHLPLAGSACVEFCRVQQNAAKLPICLGVASACATSGMRMLRVKYHCFLSPTKTGLRSLTLQSPDGSPRPSYWP